MNEEKTINSNENEKNEAIFNLIQNIQSKLNNENELDNSENETNNENENSYNNYENLNNNSSDTNNNSNSNFDISSIIGLLGNMNNSSNTDNSFNLDPKLFSKIQKIVVTLGKKDPKKDLLISLKPFLRKSRQDKIGEYITILTVIKAFEAFSDKGSDENE